VFCGQGKHTLHNTELRFYHDVKPERDKINKVMMQNQQRIQDHLKINQLPRCVLCIISNRRLHAEQTDGQDCWSPSSLPNDSLVIHQGSLRQYFIFFDPNSFRT